MRIFLVIFFMAARLCYADAAPEQGIEVQLADLKAADQAFDEAEERQQRVLLHDYLDPVEIEEIKNSEK